MNLNEINRPDIAQAEEDDDDEYRPPTREERDEQIFLRHRLKEDDLTFWKKMDGWGIDEAIALSFGVNPAKISWKSVRDYSDISPFAKEYKKRRKLMRRAVASGVLAEFVPPKAALDWLVTKEIIDREHPLYCQMSRGTANHFFDRKWTPEELENLLREHEKIKGTSARNPTALLAKRYDISTTRARGLLKRAKEARAKAQKMSILGHP